MTAAFFLEAAAKSVLCAGVTLLILLLLARRSAAERSWVAHIGLLATLLAPLAGEALPRWYVVPAATIEAPPIPPTTFAPAAMQAPFPANPMPTATSSKPTVDPDRLMLFAWAGPALLLLLATLVAVARLFALRRRATVLTDQPWLSALAHAQQRMGFKNGAALLVSRDFASPVSWGILRPTIVVNEAALDASVDAEAIIAHELAHVARLDWIKLLVARAATALFWFNPLVWMLAKACHQLREEAADDAVLMSDVRDTDYAALLVGAARHEQNGLLLAANGVAPGRSSLGRRVTRVLDGSAWRAPATVGWSLACIGIGLALAGPLGMMTAASPPPALRSAIPPRTLAAVERTPVAAAPAAEPTPLYSANASEPAAASRPVQPANLPDDKVVAPLGPNFSMSVSRLVDASQRIALATGVAVATADMVVNLPPAPPAPPAPPTRDMTSLLANGITSADLAEWAAISPSYGRFTTGQIVSLRANGVNAAWLRDMASLGYRDLPFRSLLMMAVQGANPRLVREMAAVGYTKLTPEQLTAMRIHGVSAKLVERLRRRGITNPPAQELIDYAIVGFDAERPPGSSIN